MTVTQQLYSLCLAKSTETYSHRNVHWNVHSSMSYEGCTVEIGRWPPGDDHIQRVLYFHVLEPSAHMCYIQQAPLRNRSTRHGRLYTV